MSVLHILGCADCFYFGLLVTVERVIVGGLLRSLHRFTLPVNVGKQNRHAIGQRRDFILRHDRPRSAGQSHSRPVAQSR